MWTDNNKCYFIASTCVLYNGIFATLRHGRL